VDVIEDERDGSRILLLDGASQNWVADRDWSVSLFDYIPILTHHLQRYQAPPGNALVLGLGAGTLVRRLAREGYEVEVAELDPAVAEIARAYLGFPQECCAITFSDARAFLESAALRPKRYDIIVLDVAGGGQHPEHIYNGNTYQLMERLLSPTGVMAANMVVFTSPPYDRAARHSAATVADVFPFAEAVDLHPDAGTRGDLSQLLLFGSRREPRRPFTCVKGETLYPVDTSYRPLTDDWNPLPLWSIRANAKWHSNIREWLGDGAFLR
jgi:spermidine synthase